MKICVLSKNYGYGYNGAMTSTYNLIKYWTNYGAKVLILTTNIVGQKNKDVRIIKFNDILGIIKFLKNHTLDGYLGYSDDHFGFLLKIFHISYIHTYHGNWPGALFDHGLITFLKGLILMCLYIITIHWSSYTGSVSEHSLHFISKFTKNYQIIRNGIDIKRIEKHSRIKLYSHLNIIMVGNVDERKFSLLKNVLSNIPISVLKDIRIDVYGKICNKSIFDDLKLKGVNFKGFHSKIPYYNYELLLSTSKMENLSIAAVEAINSGIPVFTFNVGGMSEIIKNGDTGIIINKYNYIKMANILIKAIRKGINLNFDNRYIINEFNWNNSAQKYINIYEYMEESKMDKK